MAKLLVDALVRFLWPPCCPACGRDLPVDRLCRDCFLVMPSLLEDERLARVGEESDGVPVTSLYRYEGQLRELLIALKYRGNRHAGRGLVQLLLAALPEPATLGRPDSIVPVPMSLRRLRQRGFNQAALLAAPLGRELAVDVLRHALRRSAHRPPQAALSGVARRKNLAGTFKADRVFGRAVLIVDDVMTTGATISAAASALFDAGARRVTALTLCRA